MIQGTYEPQAEETKGKKGYTVIPDSPTSFARREHVYSDAGIGCSKLATKHIGTETASGWDGRVLI
jgi:hypothetical protein